MTSTTGQSTADLAELRAIAEEGRKRPLLGGGQFVLFGGAIALGSLGHAAIASGLLPWPPLAIAAIWFGVMFGAVAISRLTRDNTQAVGSLGNRVEWEVWRAGGTVMGALALAIFAFAFLESSRSGSPDAWFLFVLMPPIVFGVYAIALAASAAAARANYLRPYAALSVAFAVLTTMLSGTIWQFLATAVGAFAVSVLPGLALIRRARADG